MFISIPSIQTDSLPIDQLSRNSMLEHDPSLAERYQLTLDVIKEYADKHQRQLSSINLIAVSKRHSTDKVVGLIGLGHREFAENYLQEALEKIDHVTATLDNPGITNEISWHFIGHIQSRKCREIAASFDWVHTVESTKVAEKLNRHRTGKPPLNILIQLNLQREASKSGIFQEELPYLAECVKELPNLNFRGLMIIPEIEPDFEKQCVVFGQCRTALERLNLKGFKLDQLSMGMSDDMEAAIAEGAT